MPRLVAVQTKDRRAGRIPRRGAALLLLAILLLAAPAFGWGDESHKALARGASAAMPQEAAPFFLTNMEFIAQHSLDPDYIPNRTPEQKAEHFLDIDAYGLPFSEIMVTHQFNLHFLSL